MRHYLVFAFLILTSCASSGGGFGLDGRPLSRKEYDVVLEVTPIRVKFLENDMVVDAVEDSLAIQNSGQKVVVFRIDDVLTGEFTRMKAGGPSEFEQAKEAARKHKLLKLLTLDFQNPEESVPKEWISVAVSSPFQSFGISDWENPAGGSLKIYLRRIPDHADSYLFVGSTRQKVAAV